MKKKSKIVLIILAVLLCAILAIGLWGYWSFYKLPMYNVSSEEAVRINVYPGDTWEQIDHRAENEGLTNKAGSLIRLGRLRDDYVPKVGSYLIAPNSTTISLFRRIAAGNQDPIKLVIRSTRLPQQMYAQIASKIMCDSSAIASAMNDTTLLRELNIADNTFAYHIIPNTYEVYWNVEATALVRRLKKEYDVFWTDDRLKQADNIGLTPQEVTILASIVEEESAKVDEYPRIAGLYLNRLRINMPLQADPTVKFASQDFALRRILKSHLTIDSPYNTYLNKGLPPGPIRIPSINGLKGVLNAEQHNYIYMCAKSDFSGYHAFAANYAQHLANARAYSKALNERNIK